MEESVEGNRTLLSALCLIDIFLPLLLLRDKLPLDRAPPQT